MNFFEAMCYLEKCHFKQNKGSVRRRSWSEEQALRIEMVAEKSLPKIKLPRFVFRFNGKNFRWDKYSDTHALRYEDVAAHDWQIYE